MAFSITGDKGKYMLVICGCTGCGSEECGEFETFLWDKTKQEDVNVVGRMAIASMLYPAMLGRIKIGRAHV